MDYLGGIAKEGVLGLLLAGSLVINGVLFKLLIYEKDKRIQAAEKVRDELASPLSSIDKSLALINDKVRASKGGQ